MPGRGDVDLGDGLSFGSDGVVRKGERRGVPADVPIRNDLEHGHPLRGMRALRIVPAGMPDCTLDEEGRLLPIEWRGGE